jgi:DNA mismatch endonuclease (patch repair protein)
MSKVKGKNTTLEKTVKASLKAAGIRFRANPKMFGRPDIILPKEKIAVFLDGCFWHGCKDKTIPASNKAYWEGKIKRNKARDWEVTRQLRTDGWKVIRVWEHSIKRDPDAVIAKLGKAI